jgi:glycosyltransferase involved in cell wall biosynthesis
MRRLAPPLAEAFQIIVSRVREFRPGRTPILWCQDTWNDPEARHLASPELRRRFAKIVLVSQYQFNTFTQGLGVSFAESVVLRNAVEAIPARLVTKPTDRIRLIYHTTPHRGLEILVPVFTALAARHPRLHLDVYSSFALHGWEARDVRYESLFEVCREHPQITYHGHAPNARIREALHQAHIFSYPSIWHETSCIAAIEAMATGCLTICPDLAALSETVGESGLVYRWHENRERHAERFARMLETGIAMIEDGTAGDLLHRAHDRALRTFNWDTRIDEWTHLLEEIAEDECRQIA